MLFVAMSSLQGRPMAAAFDELATLGANGAVGIQLTPGNLPTPAFAAHVAASGVATRTHHGFAWDARVAPVWQDGACVVAADSVHPPLAGEAIDWDGALPVLEVMFPGYALGSGEAVERAMADGRALAVDVSHVFIQRTAGVMTDATWRRLADYDRIAEVHVSANAGTHDSHQPLHAGAFGLSWARARLAAGTPTVVECYMHKLSVAERRAQLDLVR
jgi:hypothetical protein